MFRKAVLSLAGQPIIRYLITELDLFRPLVHRFVAGETKEDLLRAGEELRRVGLTITADYLGESVQDSNSAVAAAKEYLAVLDALAQAGLEPNISIKLSQLGLDIDPTLCEWLVERLVTRVAELDGFVRIDMESSIYTQRTLDLFAHVYQKQRAVGVVIQSALRRSAADLEWLLSSRARVRLVKGAYAEPASIAFQTKAEVDRNYALLLDRLMAQGRYPAIATHDARLVRHAMELASRYGRTSEGFEFQMLYGVRRDLQLALRQRGYRVRVYVPYGKHWYHYLTRRLAERPENLLFLLRNVVAEVGHRRVKIG